MRSPAPERESQFQSYARAFGAFFGRSPHREARFPRSPRRIIGGNFPVCELSLLRGWGAD